MSIASSIAGGGSGGGGSSPTGAAGGDLSGNYPNPSVVDDSHSHTVATLPATMAPSAHVHSGADITSGTVVAARLPSASTTAQGIVELATDGENAATVVVQANDSRLLAAVHKHGGAQEVATATPGANEIPKAESTGILARGWFPVDRFNVKSYGALGDGVANDATAIDAAVTALAASSRGGILYFPPGSYIYSGTGIVNNPAVGVAKPMVILGDGRSSSMIAFTSVSNPQCILLGAQGAIGSGANDGSGVRGVTIIVPSGKDGIVLQNLQGCNVDDVHILGGSTGLTVSECRFGRLSNILIQSPAVNGLKIVGESHSANFYSKITITSTATGSGVLWTKTSTSDTGGVYFENVVVNGTWTGSGIVVSASSVHNVFVFLNNCVTDGNFTVDGLRLIKIRKFYVTQGHYTNQAAASAATAMTLDAVEEGTVIGGQFNGTTGAGGADIALKNSIKKVTIWGPRCVGDQQALLTDGTTHDVDFRSSYFNTSTLTNDFSSIVPTVPVIHSGNVIIGAQAAGTSAARVLAMSNTATAPTSSPADMIQVFPLDVAAGVCEWFSRNEQGKVEQLTGNSTRLTTQFDKTSSAVLSNVNQLAFNVRAGEAVSFQAKLYTTSAITGGVKAGVSGTCTVTSFIAEAQIADGAAITHSRTTTFGTAIGAVTAVTGATITITGTVVVNAAGILVIQFSQNVSDVTASSILVNSWFRRWSN